GLLVLVDPDPGLPRHLAHEREVVSVVARGTGPLGVALVLVELADANVEDRAVLGGLFEDTGDDESEPELLFGFLTRHCCLLLVWHCCQRPSLEPPARTLGAPARGRRKPSAASTRMGFYTILRRYSPPWSSAVGRVHVGLTLERFPEAIRSRTSRRSSSSELTWSPGESSKRSNNVSIATRKTVLGVNRTLLLVRRRWSSAARRVAR